MWPKLKDALNLGGAKAQALPVAASYSSRRSICLLGRGFNRCWALRRCRLALVRGIEPRGVSTLRAVVPSADVTDYRVFIGYIWCHNDGMTK